MEDANATYVFRVHHYDSQSDTTKELLLFYSLESDTVELYDAKTRRLFLKKCRAPPSLERDLYINNTIQLVSRQLKIVDYGDERTRRLLASKRVTKVGIIVKPHAYKHVGEIIQRLLDAELTLSYIHMSRRRRSDDAKPHQETDTCGGETATPPEARSSCTGVPLIEIEVVGREADERNEAAVGLRGYNEGDTSCCGLCAPYSRVAAVAGPADPVVAKKEAPASLRGLYGVSTEQNVLAIVGSDDDWSNSECDASSAGAADDVRASRNIRIPEATVADRSCCIVKPSGLRHAGCIIRDIREAGFEILAMQSFHLTKNAANEFYEVYQNVLTEQPLMVEELTSGMCIAMHVEHPEKNTVKRLRELTGPFDSEIARTLRPKSLRAKYGTDRVRNAVHCTDLPEDGELEVHYFFHVLPDAFKEGCTST